MVMLWRLLHISCRSIWNPFRFVFACQLGMCVSIWRNMQFLKSSKSIGNSSINAPEMPQLDGTKDINMQLELPSILKKLFWGRHPVTKSLHYEMHTNHAKELEFLIKLSPPCYPTLYHRQHTFGVINYLFSTQFRHDLAICIKRH